MAPPVALVRGPVAVSVPATSANLGPGFDALGLALELRDHLVAELRDEPGLVVEVTGEGADGVPLDETHLVVRALRRGLAELGAAAGPGLRLRCDNAIPHARGLGSSSAAIVGGLALARALVVDGEERLDDAALVDLAADLEGHPDNVAPAALGGFVVAGADDAGWWAVPSPVVGVSAVALVPPDALSTELARGLLPDQVPHADAAANAGRAALLVTALAGAPEQLLRATADRLHQEQRRPAMPASLALVDDLRAEGWAAVVSGAGPTVLVLLGPGADPGPVLGRRPSGWRALELPVAPRGVRREG